MSKTAKKTGRFVLWVFVIMVMSFAIVGALIGANMSLFTDKIINGDSIYEGFVRNATQINYEEIKSIEGINNIIIKDVKSEVTVSSSDKDSVEVHFGGSVYQTDSNRHPELDVTIKGDELIIQVVWPKTGVFWFSSVFDKTALEVYIPKSYTGEVRIDVVSSGVKVESLMIADLVVESVSGRIDILGNVSDKLIVETVSGRINVTGDHGRINLESVSGRIELTTKNLRGDISLSTTSGSISAAIPKNVTGFRLDFDSVSGRLTNEFGQIKVQRSENNRFTGSYGTEEYKISIDTVSGSARFSEAE